MSESVSLTNINELPPEILEEIFLHVIAHPGPISTFTSLSYKSPASPFAISHVCARWRGVALNLPGLWTHLSVVRPANSGVGNLVKEWINRAGSLPLHLSLRPYEDIGSAPGITAAFAVLRQYVRSIARCRSFEVHTHNVLNFGVMPIVLSEELALLETLIITFIDPYRSTKTISFFDNFWGARNLRSVTWIGLSNFSIDRLCRSWVNLRELILDSEQSLAPFLRAISNCPHLERLTLYKGLDWNSFVPTITLPRLSYLFVTPYSHKIANYIIASSLKELQVRTGDDFRWEPTVQSLDRSAVILEILKVHESDLPYITFDEERFLRVLQLPRFQNLLELELFIPIGLDIIVFLTLGTTPAEQVSSDNSTSDNRTDHLPRLARLSLTLSLPRIPSALRNLTKLAVSRVGPIDERLMRQFLKYWPMKTNEVKFTSYETQVTFRYK